MCFDAVPVQKMCGDVCHLFTSSKLPKSLLAKCRMESLVYVYMLSRDTEHHRCLLL